MKRVYHLIIAAMIFLAGAGSVQAQAKLGLYTTSIQNTTPNIGGQVGILTQLVNVSTTDTFKGPLDFRMLHNGGEITDLAVFGKPTTPVTVTIAPNGGSINLLFNIDILGTYFVPGSDIIIVWPVAQATIIDSAKASIYINGTTGVNDLDISSISAFVANSQLMVINPTQNISVEQLQIFNLLGSPVINYPGGKGTFAVPLADLPKGVYIAQLTTSTGERKTVKFVW